MKGKFFVPKLALLASLLFFLGLKMFEAHQDLKSGRPQVETVQPVSDEVADYQPAAPVSPKAQAPVAYSQTGDAPTIDESGPLDQPNEETPAPEDSGGLWGFIKNNLSELTLGLLAFLEIIVRLTPTNTDNSILNFIKSVLDWILPNRAKAGGYH